jgi:hypothetical protein
VSAKRVKPNAGKKLRQHSSEVVNADPVESVFSDVVFWAGCLTGIKLELQRRCTRVYGLTSKQGRAAGADKLMVCYRLV